MLLNNFVTDWFMEWCWLMGSNLFGFILSRTATCIRKSPTNYVVQFCDEGKSVSICELMWCLLYLSHNHRTLHNTSVVIYEPV